MIMVKKVSPKTKIKATPKKLKKAGKKDLVKIKADKKTKGKKIDKKKIGGKIIKKQKENYLAKWTTPAFVFTDEEIWMYRISLIASAAMSFWSFYRRDFIVGITFGLLALVIAKYLFQKPADIECQIDIDGIKIIPLNKNKKNKKNEKKYESVIRKILSHEIREKFYSFNEIESFEVTEKGTYPEDSWHNYVLKIKGMGMFFPHLEIPLANQDPVYIRELMVYFVPEKKGEGESVLGEGGDDEEGYVEVDYGNNKDK